MQLTSQAVSQPRNQYRKPKALSSKRPKISQKQINRLDLINSTIYQLADGGNQQANSVFRKLKSYDVYGK